LRGRNLKRLEPGADEGGLAVALGAVFLAVVGFVGLIASLLVFVIAVDRDLDRLRVAVGDSPPSRRSRLNTALSSR